MDQEESLDYRDRRDHQGVLVLEDQLDHQDWTEHLEMLEMMDKMEIMESQ